MLSPVHKFAHMVEWLRPPTSFQVLILETPVHQGLLQNNQSSLCTVFVHVRFFVMKFLCFTLLILRYWYLSFFIVRIVLIFQHRSRSIWLPTKTDCIILICKIAFAYILYFLDFITFLFFYLMSVIKHCYFQLQMKKKTANLALAP